MAGKPGEQNGLKERGARPEGAAGPERVRGKYPFITQQVWPLPALPEALSRAIIITWPITVR